ncbi:major capsid protein [Marinobacterium litorale]|uniref:major capsid protein n=1 Tax=Marinobacterium litorale TaxID=404770 RepID=UPI00041C76C9|nr:major capsid protein [Marinobacterium litorale]
MATIDIFNDDAFKMVTLTDALNKTEFQPSLLRSMNIFTPRRVRTETVAIEEKNGVLNVIATSARGAPLEQKTKTKRNIRDFRTNRIAKQDTITASELANIRAFGSETELVQVQAEVADRLNGPSGLMREMELTWEHQMLGAVQGIVYDADNSTVINNWFDEWGVTQDAEIDFDLDNATPASGAVRKKCNQVIRQMQKAAGGAWVPGRTQVVGLCGDAFWDDLTAHEEPRQTYLNTQEAADLRNDVGMPYESFRYGGITWINYRGTDDDSKVAIGADKVKFFPVNAPGAFQAAYSPGEWFDVINTPGQDVYAMTLPDTSGRNAFVDVEVYSYPLFICTRPKMLQRGKRT